MWKIKGEEYHIGDSVFVARGIILPKVERYSIIKPRHRGRGGLFGGGWDGFAYASNGREVVRINKRGNIVDDIFFGRKVVSRDLARLCKPDPMPMVCTDIQARLDVLDTTIAKVRLLQREGFAAGDIAQILGVRLNFVTDVLKH